MSDEAQKILKAIADLNDHNIQPSAAEIFRRAFSRPGDKNTRTGYSATLIALTVYREVEMTDNGFVITELGRNAIAELV